MGLLTDMTESAQVANGSSEQNLANMQESVIQTGARLWDENSDYQEYTNIGTMLESDNVKDRYDAGLTLLMVERTKSFIKAQEDFYGEAVVQQSLNTIPKRVLDVVRIFYPNQIANELIDIQPIDGRDGTIFTMRPTFTDTFNGVTAGDEIFKKRTNDSNYASEEFKGTIGEGDGATTSFSATPAGAILPVRPNTVKVTTYVDSGSGQEIVTAVDDGNGNLVGVGIAAGSTINYATAAFVVNYDTAPDDLIPPPESTNNDIVICYCYDSEESCEEIRSVEFEMDEVPVRAKIHPILFKYTVSAGLVAKAHFAIDVQDTLAQLAAQYIKIERDEKLVRLIRKHATYHDTLDFDATAPAGYQKNAFYGEFETKMDEAESLIQQTQGRGSIDWVVAGRNVINIIRNIKGFRPTPVEAPIGPHVVGTLRDGTVTVVKVIDNGVLDKDDFVFGYKGYMAGDAALVLAEWIPVYFTPVHQSPRFKNEQGIMSMYDMFVNNAGYYVRGKVTNYGA